MADQLRSDRANCNPQEKHIDTLPLNKYKNGRKIYRDPFTAWKRGKLMNEDVKTTVMNVFVKLQIENPSMTTEELFTACSDLTGVSENAISLLWTEFREKGSFATPRKKKRLKNTDNSRRNVKCSESTLCAVRQIVYEIFRRGEMPTLNKILAVIEGDPSVDVPMMEIAALDRVLKDIGFVNLISGKSRRPNSILVEKDEIVLWRRKYLREIKGFRSDNRKIYYLDETSIDVDNRECEIQPDSTAGDRDAAFLSGKLEIALENPSKTLSRIIIMHAGSADGFVAGAATIFLTEKGGELIDGSFFETWFEEKLLPILQPSSVIVLDNAWYHSLKVESLPTVSWRRCEIENWLTEKHVAWNTEQLKPELLQLVESNAQQYNIYRIYKIAEMYGHKVLCLPPLHSNLNPMEQVWLLVNKHVAAWKTPVSALEAKRQIETVISKITPKQWAVFESKVIAQETEMWKMAELIEDMVDSALVSNQGYSSSESDESGLYFEEELMTGLREVDKIDMDTL